MLTSAILMAGADPPSPTRGAFVAAGRELAPGLIPVLDRPLIAHAIEDMASIGVEEVVVVVDRAIATQASSILDQEVRNSAAVSVVERDPALSLPAAIARARMLLDDGPFLLRFADCLGRSGLSSHLSVEDVLGDHDAIALTSRFHERGEEDPGLVGDGSERETSEFQVGVFALGRRFPIALADDEASRSASAMDAALKRMEESGGQVERRLVAGWWRHRGHPDSCLAANGFMLAAMTESSVAGVVSNSAVEGAVRCHPTARIESSVIRGPAAIGANAIITDAFIGPFSSIGRGVRIDGAEIENSVILEDSVVCDVGARLDSSVIGPRATISRDFRIPRGTRLNVGPGASVSF